MNFPYIKRTEGIENESNVRETINFLLKKACEKAGTSTKGIDWTTCRHTAFNLTLEEYPELGTTQDIRDFADNGHTSPKMLEEGYLRFIQREKTASSKGTGRQQSLQGSVFTYKRDAELRTIGLIPNMK